MSVQLQIWDGKQINFVDDCVAMHAVAAAVTGLLKNPNVCAHELLEAADTTKDKLIQQRSDFIERQKIVCDQFLRTARTEFKGFKQFCAFYSALEALLQDKRNRRYKTLLVTVNEFLHGYGLD